MEHHPQVPNTAHSDSSSNGKKNDKFNPNDPQATLEVERKGDVNRLTSSPLHYENGGAPQQNTGSNRSIEQSPLNPHSRVGRKGSAVSSPSWNKKGTSEGSHGIAPSTPGRSRLRSVTRGDETPEHSPAIPKFGDWDDSDPASAEGYSGIFSRVREERQSGGGRVPVMPTETSYSNVQRQYGNQNEKGCWCFPWGRS